MNFSDWLFKEEGGKRIIKIHFASVKYDTVDKYYVDLSKARGMLISGGGIKEKFKASDVKVGDLVEDMVPSAVPYWKVHDIDVDKNIIYLEPYGKNPFVPSASGEIVGAGGHKFGQHDFDVMSGDYERKRIDDILDIINKKKYHDIDDIAYILLGTVPVEVGPNGSQGGWYNVGDGNNRGSLKGMEVSEIIAKDANTLKNKLGFDVPDSALSGELDAYTWNDFVGGDTQRWNLHKTQLPFEDFADPVKMAGVVMGRYAPAIRLRNLEMLLYLGRETDEHDDLIRDLSKKMVSDKALDDDFDRLWGVKERLIRFASQKGWEDIIEMYEDAHDADNQTDVVRHYGESKQLDKLLAMLDKSKAIKPIKNILSYLVEIAMGSDERWFSFHSPTMVRNHFESNPEDKARAAKLLRLIVPVVNRNMSKIHSLTDSYSKTDVDIYLNRLSILKDVVLGDGA